MGKGCHRPLPQLSLAGDTCLVLDSGCSLRAHRLYLQHASCVFEDALACTPAGDTAEFDTEEGHDSKADMYSWMPTRLPLPNTSERQAHLLLQCLYCWERAAWADSLRPPELIELARVAHRFGCTSMLDVADKAMVKTCGAVDSTTNKFIECSRAWLNAWEAPSQLQLAQSLGLTRYAALVGRFMGRFADKIELRSVDAHIGAILQGACLRGN